VVSFSVKRIDALLTLRKVNQIITCSAAAVLMVAIVHEQSIVHTGPNAGSAPVAILGAIISYLFGIVSLALGRCYTKYAPSGGYTIDDDPVSFWCGIYGYFAFCAFLVWIAYKL
jgi:hypothetical protein